MSLDTNIKRAQLNRVTHSVRASQAVLQYGVGAMVDFPDQTLMTAAPEYWEDKVIQIHDERLEKHFTLIILECPVEVMNRNFVKGFRMQDFRNGIFVLNVENFNQLNHGWMIIKIEQVDDN